MMRTLLIIVVIFSSFSVYGGELSGDTEDALRKTQEMLTNPAERQREINSDAGRAADDQVRQIAKNPEDAEAIYRLAAEVFGDLMKQNGGDVDKVSKTLSNAAVDPEAFASTWSQEHLQELHEIGKRLQPEPSANVHP